MASGGLFYGLASEEVSLQSYARSGTSGISLISGRDAAGYVRIQQQEYSASSAAYETSDRVVVTPAVGPHLFCLLCIQLAFIETQGAHVVSVKQPHPPIQADRPLSVSGLRPYQGLIHQRYSS